MGVIYRYLSSALVPSDDASPSTSSASRFKDRVYRLLPKSAKNKSKVDDLSLTCVKSHDLICNSLLFAMQYETIWWIRLNFGNLRRNQPLVLPSMFHSSQAFFSWTDWKLYLQRFKMRVWPVVFEYQTTLSIMYLLQVLVGMVVSEKTMQRLTQHPYQRALVVAQSTKDRVSVGVDSFVTCLWCNALFFTSTYLFGSLFIVLNYRAGWSRRLRGPLSDPYQYFVVSAWRHTTTIFRRYYTSALGAGIGSAIWPGAGTLLGMGIGDGIGELTPSSDVPDFGRMRRQARGIWKQLSMMMGSGKSVGKGDPSWHDDVDKEDNPYKAKDVDDSLMCGCCQTTMFSSDPSCPERAPVSSRECSHTICKHCVEKCHLALMERTQTYQAWISCPLCKAMNAFSSHTHLINRNLCGAIAVIEQLQEQQAQQ